VSFDGSFEIVTMIYLLLSRYYDPRVWVREGEKTMTKRIDEALKDFNTAGQA